MDLEPGITYHYQVEGETGPRSTFLNYDARHDTLYLFFTREFHGGFWHKIPDEALARNPMLQVARPYTWLLTNKDGQVVGAKIEHYREAEPRCENVLKLEQLFQAS